MDDKKPEDDFDDIDFEDLDDDFSDDDLIDEDDDFSDDADLDASLDENFEDDDEDDWGTETDSNVDEKPKKGGVGKLLLPLLLLTAIGGGGAYYYTQILNAPGQGLNPAPAVQNNFSQEEQQATNIDNAMQPVANTSIEPPQPETDISLPMPSPISKPVENNMQDAQTPPSLAEIEAMQPPSQFEDNMGLDEPVFDNNIDDVTDPGVLTPMPNIVSQEAGEIDQMNITEDSNLQIENEVDLSQNEIISVAEPQIEEVVAFEENSMDSAQLQFNNEELENVKQANTRLEEQVSNLLSGSQKKDSKIEELSAKLTALQQELSEKEKALEKSEAQIQQMEKTASVDQKPQKQAPKVQKSVGRQQSTQKTTNNVSIKPQWELRAAQPGEAYIAIKNSNNVLVVSTGDTIQGIGKIQSINIEDNLWVVRGTQGVIRQ